MEDARSQSFVLDSSVAIAWVVKSQATEATDSLLQNVFDGTTLWVPVLWSYEFGNVLLTLSRRRRLSEEDRNRAQSFLFRLEAQIDDDGLRRKMDQTTNLAVRHKLSLYDAAYLELALRLEIPLATRDVDLAEAATKCRVTVLPRP